MGVRTPALDQWGEPINGNEYGYINAGTGTNDSPATIGVTNNWTNPGNITTTITTEAVISSAGAGPFVFPYLRASNFGFNVPSGGTITGVELFIEVGATNTDYRDAEVRLIIDATPTVGSTNKGNVAAMSTGVDLTYGGDGDLWGETTSVLTPAFVNSSDFGAVLKVDRTTTATTRVVGILSMSMAIYFTGTDGEARVTQNFAETIYIPDAGEVRVTQNFAEVIYVPENPLTFPAGRRQFVITSL